MWDVVRERRLVAAGSGDGGRPAVRAREPPGRPTGEETAFFLARGEADVSRVGHAHGPAVMRSIGEATRYG